MSTRRTALGGAVLALALGACSSSHHGATPPAQSTTTPPATGVQTFPTVSSTTATTSPSASTSAPSTAPAGPGQCTASDLTGSLVNPNGAAGSVYWTLLVTNHGSGPCILKGYPGVSFVSSAGGSQVGAAAARTPGSASSITLAPNASAGAALQITEATNYGSGCGITDVAGLRVYPPNQTASLFIAHSEQACANTSDVTLHVGAFQASG